MLCRCTYPGCSDCDPCLVLFGVLDFGMLVVYPQVPNWLRRALGVVTLKGPQQELFMAQSILNVCESVVSERLTLGEDMQIAAIAQTIGDLFEIYEEERAAIAATIDEQNRQAIWKCKLPPCCTLV
jgi:hypothetical protein